MRPSRLVRRPNTVGNDPPHRVGQDEMADTAAEESRSQNSEICMSHILGTALVALSGVHARICGRFSHVLTCLPSCRVHGENQPSKLRRSHTGHQSANEWLVTAQVTSPHPAPTSSDARARPGPLLLQCVAGRQDTTVLSNTPDPLPHPKPVTSLPISMADESNTTAPDNMLTGMVMTPNPDAPQAKTNNGGTPPPPSPDMDKLSKMLVRLFTQGESPPPPPPDLAMGGCFQQHEILQSPPQLGGRTVRCACAVYALCARCAKSRPFSTTGRQLFPFLRVCDLANRHPEAGIW